MLVMNLIERTQLGWAKRPLIAPKMDGSLRCCVNYRRFNALTVQDWYSIPRMDACIDSFGDAEVFSAREGNCGPGQSEIEQTGNDKTAFSSHHGLHFWFLRMPFGLERGRDILKSTMAIRSLIPWRHCYLLRERASPRRGRSKILTLLRESAVTSKPRMYFFFNDGIEFLRHVIRPRHFEFVPRPTDGIKNLKPPATVTQLCWILGIFVANSTAWSQTSDASHHCLTRHCARENDLSSTYWTITILNNFLNYSPARRSPSYYTCLDRPVVSLSIPMLAITK